MKTIAMMRIGTGTEQASVAQAEEDGLRIGNRHGLALIEAQREPARDHHRGQGDNKRRHFRLARAEPVKHAKRRRDQQSGRHRGKRKQRMRPKRRLGEHIDRAGAHQRHHRAHGQVDTANQNDQRHAERQDGVHRDLLGQVNQILGRKKIWNPKPKQHQQNDDGRQQWDKLFACSHVGTPEYRSYKALFVL
jgi:hypothetical protein